MRGGKYNRSLIAGFMLLIFIVGMTPRMFLHDIFSNHRHTYETRSEHPGILPKGFQCDVKSLVAKAPFIEQEVFGIEPLEVSHYPSFTEALIHFYHTGVFSDYSLRGPPAFFS
jgi:hypothetical protein